MKLNNKEYTITSRYNINMGNLPSLFQGKKFHYIPPFTVNVISWANYMKK